MGISILASQSKAQGAQKLVHIPAIMRFDPYWYGSLDAYSDGSAADVSLIPSGSAGGVNPVAGLAIGTMLSNSASYLSGLFFDSNKRSGIANNGEIKIGASSWVSSYKGLRAIRYATLLKGITAITAPDWKSTNYPQFSRFIALDSSRFLVTYQASTDSKLYAIVGSIDAAGVITWGTAVKILDYTQVDRSKTDAVLVNTDKVIVCSAGNSNYGSVVALSISGTTITAGSPAVFSGTNTLSYCRIDKIGTDKAMVAYTDSGSATTPKACVITVSGTTCTAGSPVSGSAAGGSISNYMIHIQADGTDKAIVTYSYGSLAYAAVVTVSGTTPTWGTALTIPTGAGYNYYTLRTGTGRAVVQTYNNSSGKRFLTLIGWSGSTISVLDSITYPNTTSFDSDHSPLAENYSGNKWSMMIGYAGGSAFAINAFDFDLSDDKITLYDHGQGKTSIENGVGQLAYKFYAGSGASIMGKVGSNYVCLGDLGNTTISYNYGYFIQNLGQMTFYKGDATLGDVLIGTDTADKGFWKRSYYPNLALGGDHVYLKAKNTSGATISLELYDVALEVE